MARIRAALQRAESPSEKLTAPSTAAGPEQPPPALLPPVPAMQTEEIPYIEVGGKNMPIDASPSVLACTPKPRLKIHAPAVEPEKQLSLPTHPIQEAEPATLSFQSLQSGIVPLKPVEQRLHARLIAFHQPTHAVSQQYRLIGEHVGAQLPARKAQALLFTSAPLSTDTATVLVNLAITRVREAGVRVALVEADVHNPTVAEALGLEAAPGLLEVLSGGLSLDRVLQPTGIDNLVALTGGQGSPDSRLLMGGDSMKAILRHLKERFEWVLVHAPRWDGRPEVVSLGAFCDAVYLILPRAQAQAKEVKELMQLIPIQGGRLRGCIYI